MDGKRCDDYDDFFAHGPGAYRPVSFKEGDATRKTWHVLCPGCGTSIMLHPNHIPTEEADGTLTLTPQPTAGGMNSFFHNVPECGWHGYIDHGVWRTV